MVECEYWDRQAFSVDSTSVEIRDGKVFDVSSAKLEEFRLRAFHRGAWAFLSTSFPEKVGEELEKVRKMAVRLSRHVKRHRLGPAEAGGKFFQKVSVDPSGVSFEEKMRKAVELEKAGRIAPNLNTVLNYSDNCSSQLLTTSEGVESEQKNFICGAFLLSIAREGNLLQRNFRSRRMTGGWEVVRDLDESFSAECSQKALDLLRAKPAPSGEMTVIMDPELLGTFIHEALGHACEGDIVANKESILRGKIGKKIAPENVTVGDDARIEGGFGSFGLDRDGTCGGKTVLVEKGRLVSYLNSRDSAGKLGQESTGTCRGKFNQVRMSNTVMERGDSSLEEMVRETKRGVYMRGSTGGQVSPASGDFNFAAVDGYLVEKGEIKERLRDVMLIGNTLKILGKTDLVGKDFGLKSGVCGKGGEWVPVGSGGPTVRTVALVGGKS